MTPVCRLASVAVATLVLAGLGLGCAPCQKRETLQARPLMRPSNLIFNAESAPHAIEIVARSDWPSTFVADRGLDETAFRETIRDRQGISFNDQYQFRRHFTSVRTGTERR